MTDPLSAGEPVGCLAQARGGVHIRSRRILRAGAAVAAIIVAAAAAQGQDQIPAAARTRTPGQARSPIEHIVFIAKENRSFDHYFGAMPDPGNDLEQSTTASCYQKSNPSVVDTFTMPAAPDPMPQDVSHANSTFYAAYHNGKMDGFCHEKGAHVQSTGADIADTQMQSGEIPNYWAYAKAYGIGDEMFASWRGASFANNVFAVAAQTGRYSTLLNRRAIFGNPVDPVKGSQTWGCSNSADTTVTMIDLQGALSSVYPCFGFESMPDLMDRYGVTWRYYSSPGSHFVHTGISAIQSIRCAQGDTPPCEQPNPYWDNHVHDANDFLTDAAAGTLPNVSWYLAKQTEHPPKTACKGENATVKAINSVMKGTDWRSTAIVVWWDEWGGFYDHVKPPTADGVDGTVTGLNALISYGFRVPLLVISPWSRSGPLADGGYASHDFYSHASFARFVEWAFDLPTLGAADDLSKYSAAEPTPGDLTDFFDFSSTTPPKGKMVLPQRTCPTLTAAQRTYVRTMDDD
jgi:phospholipase C